MVRTIISLDAAEKTWLDQRAEEEEMSMTQLVRKALRRYRESVEAEGPSLERQLRETAGLWRGEEGLQYQRRMRAEWDGRA
jgi:hypothetical protein